MTVQPLGSARPWPLDIPAVPLVRLPAAPNDALPFAQAVSNAFEAAGAALERADGAERAFASGRGGLQEMVLERAQADIALSLASAATSRVAQSLTTILGMQV